MGLYIEVPNKFGKVQQIRNLDARVQRLGGPPVWQDIPEGFLAVCVVWNPNFEAAAVAYEKREIARFNDPRDDRPKTWLLVPTDLVKRLAPGYSAYMGGE